MTLGMTDSEGCAPVGITAAGIEVLAPTCRDNWVLTPLAAAFTV